MVGEARQAVLCMAGQRMHGAAVLRGGQSQGKWGLLGARTAIQVVLTSGAQWRQGGRAGLERRHVSSTGWCGQGRWRGQGTGHPRILRVARSTSHLQSGGDAHARAYAHSDRVAQPALRMSEASRTFSE